MAEDWIKMRLNLHEDSAVIAMAIELGTDEFSVVGRLHRLWSWADQQTEDGSVRNLSAAFVDRFVSCTGFFRAMERVGWISEIENGFQFPNFCTHNGENAKKRAKENRRKSSARKQKSVSAKCPQNVRDLSAKCPEKTGPEKRREEKNREEYLPSSPSPPNEARGEGGEGDANWIPSGWQAMEIRLRELGMLQAGEAVDWCRGQGLSPEDVAKIVDYWATKPVGYWPSMVGALHHKLTHLIEGEPFDSAFPAPAPKFQQREANTNASLKRQEARQRESIAKSETQVGRTDERELEAMYGPQLDSMDPEERERIIAEVCPQETARSLFRRGWQRPASLHRTKLLKFLAEMKVPISF